MKWVTFPPGFSIAANKHRADDSGQVLSRGVDSVGSGFTDPAKVVKALAQKRAAVVVLTGVEDYISDGEIVLKASNGHELVSHSHSLRGRTCK